LPETKQLPLPFVVNTAWVHFFSSMITEGKLAVIKPEGLAILLALKTLAQWKDGTVSIANETLAQRACVSVRKLKKTIPILEEEGYISIHRNTPNSRTEYTLYDVLEGTDADGVELEPIRVLYQPKSLGDVKSQIDQWSKTGDDKILNRLGDKVIVLVQNNHYNQDNSTHNNTTNIENVGQLIMQQGLNRDLQEILLRMATRQPRGDDSE